MIFASLRKRLFGRTKPVMEYDGHNWDLAKGCPDCGSTEILIGPSGSASQNMCCANPECRSAFNWSLAWMERIGNAYFRSTFPDNPTESEAYLNANKAQLGQ